MKKFTVILLAFFYLVSFMNYASATDQTWYCNTCKEDRDTAFCPVCGTARPDMSKEDRSAKSWPVIELVGTDTSLRTLSDDEQRHQSYYGPSKEYPGDGAYKPKKATSVKALFREGDFVLTDLTYQTVGRRILYFKANSLKNADVEYVTLTGYPAHTIGAVIPKQGPGSMYDNVQQTKVPDLFDYTLLYTAYYDDTIGDWVFEDAWGYIDEDNMPVVMVTDPQVKRYNVCLYENTEINVFFETNGWVYAEFNCSIGKVRAWLPVATIE